jgi:hypothetical protein
MSFFSAEDLLLAPVDPFFQDVHAMQSIERDLWRSPGEHLPDTRFDSHCKSCFPHNIEPDTTENCDGHILEEPGIPVDDNIFHFAPLDFRGVDEHPDVNSIVDFQLVEESMVLRPQAKGLVRRAGSRVPATSKPQAKGLVRRAGSQGPATSKPQALKWEPEYKPRKNRLTRAEQRAREKERLEKLKKHRAELLLEAISLREELAMTLAKVRDHLTKR